MIGRPHAARTEVPCAPCSTKNDKPTPISRPSGSEVFWRARISDRADGRYRTPQTFGMVAAIEMFADHVVEWHLFGADHVPQSHFVRLQPDFASNGIHDHLDCQADARSCDPAVGDDRTFVGRDGSRTAPICREDVRPGQQVGNLRGLGCRRNRIGGICACIDVSDAVDRQKLAVLRCVTSDLIVVFPAIGVCAEMLPAIFEPAHGMIDLQRKPAECDFFTAQQSFVSEAAPYVGEITRTAPSSRSRHSHRPV